MSVPAVSVAGQGPAAASDHRDGVLVMGEHRHPLTVLFPGTEQEASVLAASWAVTLRPVEVTVGGQHVWPPQEAR